MLDGEDLFPDNWIYIHEPDVEVGRIQNYRSWSPWMVPDPSTACVGLEYFCFKGDELWTMDDDALVDLATRELAPDRAGHAGQGQARLRRARADGLSDVRRDYAERVEVIRGWLETIPNLTQVGRNGLHRYNNSDHSMLTAMRAVDNLLRGTDHDIWAVNAESAYHEEHEEPEQPYINVPEPPSMAEPLASESR